MNVWVNGCFDILHTGHIDLLEYAKRVGSDFYINNLIVGIDSDKRVKELKGEGRPVNSQLERKRMLKAIGIVNEVHVFNSDAHLRELIEILNIDLMVVGDEYEDKEVIGEEKTKFGVRYYKVDNRSTTNIIDKIKKEIFTEMWEEFKDDNTVIGMGFNNYAVGKLSKL